MQIVENCGKNSRLYLGYQSRNYIKMSQKVYKIEELVEKYHAQIDYYGRALEQITGKKVKEKVLYSFTLGEACSLS